MLNLFTRVPKHTGMTTSLKERLDYVQKVNKPILNDLIKREQISYQSGRNIKL